MSTDHCRRVHKTCGNCDNARWNVSLAGFLYCTLKSVLLVKLDQCCDKWTSRSE